MLCACVSGMDEAVVGGLCVLPTSVFGVGFVLLQVTVVKKLGRRRAGQQGKCNSVVPFPLLGLESDRVKTGGPRQARGKGCGDS